MKLLLTIATVLAFAVPAFADEEKTCPPGMTLPEVQASIAATQGASFAMVPQEEIGPFLIAVSVAFGGKVPADVTNIIVAALDGYMVFGIEVEGCMSPPIPFPAEAAAPTRFSGQLPDGSVWA